SAGTAPGAMASSNDENVLYVVSETGDKLSVFYQDSVVQVLSDGDLVTDIDGNDVVLNGLNGASSVAVSGNDRFVYVTGKDSNSVSVFERDFTSNTLTLVETFVNGLKGVRGLASATDVTLSPDGQYAMVSGAESNAIAVFHIPDSATGRLEFVQLLRNNVSDVTGLTEPSSLAVSVIGSQLYAGSGLGLVEFTNVVRGDTLPDPVVFT
ncbi:MAG: lactonase family protein, partial [Fuerstiella sp.]|nr:lactonase family protein [Fuerstiella sp.]